MLLSLLLLASGKRRYENYRTVPRERPERPVRGWDINRYCGLDHLEHTIERTIPTNDTSVLVMNQVEPSIRFILDREPPKFELCQAIAQNTDGGKPTGMVTWEPPTASDNSLETLNVTCNPESGSDFKIGLTAVICEATDSSGNAATCSFHVEIRGMQFIY